MRIRGIKAIGTASYLALVKVMNILIYLSQKVSNGTNKCNLETMCIHSGKPCRDTSFRLLRSNSLNYLECWSPHFTPAETFSCASCRNHKQKYEILEKPDIEKYFFYENHKQMLFLPNPNNFWNCSLSRNICVTDKTLIITQLLIFFLPYFAFSLVSCFKALCWNCQFSAMHCSHNGMLICGWSAPEKYLLYSKSMGDHRFWWRKSRIGGCPQSWNFYRRDQCSVHCPWIITRVKLKIVEEKTLFQDQEYFPLDN